MVTVTKAPCGHGSPVPSLTSQTFSPSLPRGFHSAASSGNGGPAAAAFPLPVAADEPDPSPSAISSPINSTTTAAAPAGSSTWIIVLRSTGEPPREDTTDDGAIIGPLARPAEPGYHSGTQLRRKPDGPHPTRRDPAFRRNARRRCRR